MVSFTHFAFVPLLGQAALAINLGGFDNGGKSDSSSDEPQVTSPIIANSASNGASALASLTAVSSASVVILTDSMGGGNSKHTAVSGLEAASETASGASQSSKSSAGASGISSGLTGAVFSLAVALSLL
ncbi:hypothetical protein EJF18_70011 [Clavispora lusitaniae]|uniref:Uncharacterized protein n=1 Tax=Clavispora lusitaniae TaxID=36911 RepID=A0ACD0WRM0_CLALS|nr:hypothetical protein EJF14_70011 [Clavispora lusitaniae]QFZ35614.1 hypothetical protein EJF16_70011 [Clavispora lusitaniae]QFZ41296.1 hypothetical protein EJF15_70011 [Clavispora lusitaniae]QFZ46974.1 hypothetical protein EJF18_70011 [Clavispora lusitaniae]QFZ52651.1 hypothetical protein EJF17_70011 [Clavispora lusitaniae]